MQTERELTGRLFATVLQIKEAGFFVTLSYHTDSPEREAIAVIQVYRSYSDWFHDGKPISTVMPSASLFDLARQQLVRDTGILAV
jgi:hypothetical protein